MGAIENAILEIVAKSGLVDEDKVRAMVDQAIKAMPAQRLEISLNGGPPKELKTRCHAAFTDVAKRISAGVRDFLFVGPSGSGKTYLMRQLAEAFDRKVCVVSCSIGSPPSDFTGSLLPDGKVTKLEVIERYRTGGLIGIDEEDKLDAGVGAVTNAMKANGSFFSPALGERIERHPDTIIIGTANTWGTGASQEYIACNQFDAATLDRYVGGMIHVDYDQELEKTFGPAWLVEWVHALREKVGREKVRRLVTGRMILKGAQLDAAYGGDKSLVCKALLAGWTEEELKRVGVGS